MTNRGLFSGIKRQQWTDYTPQWRCASLGGATPATQPALGTGGSLTGRYIRHPAGFIAAQVMLNVGTSPTIGSSASLWELSLPFPAYRTYGDLPIGTGYATLGTAATVQSTQVVVPTLSDPLASGTAPGSRTDEDYWVQGFCNRIVAYGVSGDANSVAFTSGVSSVTVTHNLGVLTGYIPNAYDIRVVATNSASTTPKALYVTAVGATTFTLNVTSSSTTTPLTYAWKIEAEPNSSGASILVGPTAPFTWGDNSTLAYSLLYETRR